MNDLSLPEITATRLFVLQRAIAALIVTHPDPARFAAAFEQATQHADVSMLYADGETEFQRAVADEFSQELLGLALDEVARRRRGG